MATTTCDACGTANDLGRKFCGECGEPLTVACPTCSTENAPGVKFCGECGASLTATPDDTAETAQPVSERRLVSVLFADLVGHTSFSDGRDAEDVRELLSRYFDTARTVIERYGGTVEKFIGDAVMAVWGTPVAHEDDAERAVRAALDLVDAIPTLAPGLAARAGVLTGEAAITIGAEGQGMVAGDLVNTASRIQATADPGTVLVGETTARATEAAIVYEAAGVHPLKGKTEPVPVWKALRVIGLRGGSVKPAGLEPPFVGRERELRLVKELFHASAEDRRAHLVSVVGVGGIGKSRLAWEFEKYVDGLFDLVWWHSGRCLAYGDGVAFWALAEMVRGRSGIVEDEDSASALSKLRAAVALHIPDAEERRFVEPRLAHLLGLEESAAGDQENLFAAARMFFERLAEQGPTVLVFEDIHWADSALLDFVEYLAEWSRDVPLFILTLARPELAERRPTWGAGKRNFTSIFLEPLSADAMDVLLTEPVPGLPDELRARILGRAEGVPFYAVETVRMLLDRGLVVREGNSYRPTAEIETLEVPETLQALIAARLDGLGQEERRVVQEAAVLGRTFTLRGLATVSGLDGPLLEPLLTSLVRKEIVSLSADPMSPERGQYGFLQDLVKKVAYDTLSRKDRKALHLAAATYLRSLGDDDETVEVVAAHYLDAYTAAPDDPDADDVKGQARDALVRAGDRAASLAATAEAEGHFERAAELADDPLVQAELRERAGVVAAVGGRAVAATAHFERALELFEARAATRPAARVSARLAETMWERGRHADALQTMDRSFQALAQETPDADFATLAAQLGRFMFFAGDTELALQRIETALQTAEALLLPETLSMALNTKAIALASSGRPREASTLLRDALAIALEHDKPSAALRAYYNLADLLLRVDRYEESLHMVQEGVRLAHRVGNRYWEQNFAGQLYPFYALGRWDDVLRSRGDIPKDWRESRLAFATLPIVWVPIHVHRGAPEEAERIVEMLRETAESADAQERSAWRLGHAGLLFARGDMTGCMAAAEEVLAVRSDIGIGSEPVKEAFGLAVEAALALGDRDKARELVAWVEELPVGLSSPFLQAQATRFRAHLATEPKQAERELAGAAMQFRELAVPFSLAVTLLEHAERLAGEDRTDEAGMLAVEAREIFELLGAVPWLERLDSIDGVREAIA